MRRLTARRLSLFLLTALTALAIAAVVGERSRAPVAPSQAQDLRQMVARMLADAPRAGDGYRIPSAEESRLAAAMFRAAHSGRTGTARRLGRAIGYEVVELDGSAGGVVVVQEAAGESRGWGLYAFATTNPSDLIVEVAHPISDLHSPAVGLELFLTGRGAALLVAGAHRDASPTGHADVAHQPDSLFQLAHEATLSRESIVVQPHGFHADRDRDFEAVVSSGDDEPSPRSEAAAEALGRTGIDTCLYGARECDDLGGTTNVQGRSASRAGADFLHLELGLNLREDPGRRAELTRGIVAALVD